MRNQKVLFAALIGIGLILSGGSLWQLWEQDIFWQIRAGAELIQGSGFPTVDTWSITVAGEAWRNYQWLSSILFHFVHVFSGENGLIIFRALLVALYLFSLFFVLRTYLKREWAVPVSLCLLPLFYFATSYRLQLRPDFLVLILFTFFPAFWFRLQTPRARLALTAGAIVLGSNLHSGTAVFLVFIAVVLALTTKASWRARIVTAMIASLAYFATPYHYESLLFAFRHFFYYQHNVLKNPEYAPFAISMLNPNLYGWYVISWILLVVFGIASLVFLSRRHVRDRERQSRGNGLESLIGLWVAFLVLTILAIKRERAVPFHVSMTALVFSRAIGADLTEASAEKATQLLRGLQASAAFVIIIMIPIQLTSFPVSWGIRENPWIFPIGSVKFIKDSNLKGPIYHTPDYGNYILGKLPDEKVFIDTREVMYDSIQQEYGRGMAESAVAKKLIDRYGIQIILMPIRFMVTVKKGADPDLRRERIAPSSEWAVVYFDDISAVFVRRRPEIKAIIDHSEYRFLLPYKPASAYLKATNRTPETDRIYLAEIQRCLATEPANTFCSSTFEAFGKSPLPFAEAGR